ncbi:MAG: NAD(P)H-hydrate dehydratase [Deltaproteobacteria bacterium]|nr:NAD(P)H-hydrate dehydratase [Candidatus Tharpella sp.]
MTGDIKLLNAVRMRALDGRAIHEIGIPGVVLMEQAGRGAVRIIEAAGWLGSRDDEVLLFAGKGNNGGDAFVVARVLLLAGYRRVKVALLAAADAIGGDAKINLDAFIHLGGQVEELLDEACWQDLKSTFQVQKLLVDGLLGTGLNSDVRGLYAEIIASINQFLGPVLALDIPSGLHADSGLPLGNAVKATATATFAFAKPGLFVYPGREYAGRVEIVDIGIPRSWADEEKKAVQLLTSDFCRPLLPPTPAANNHKGNRGHLLSFAGGPGKAGAGLLAAGAGLHCGCGLSTLALPATVAAYLEGRNPALMLEALPQSAEGQIMLPTVADIEKLCSGKTALAIGPGFGLHKKNGELLAILLRECSLPMVLDADALTLLAGAPEIMPKGRRHTILTPHPGEMARLLKCKSSEIQNDRLASARKLALQWGVHIVLKGAGTVIAAPDGSLSINDSGNYLLSTAGSGDLLTGIVGSFLAQGSASLVAAQTGVFLHGLIADRLLAAGFSHGVTAVELGQALPETLSALVLGDI